MSLTHRNSDRPLVTEGKVFPDNSLIVGSPAKILRQLTSEEVAKFQVGTSDYVGRSRRYKVALEPLADKDLFDGAPRGAKSSL